jgi:hypothetical protein
VTPALVDKSGALVASIHRLGGGRKPIRWRPYFSTRADRLGAPAPAPECTTLDAARAYVRLWAQAQGLGELVEATVEG